MSYLKKIKTISIDVLGTKKVDFIDCSGCKYADITEAACRVMGCAHAFDRLYECYEEKERKEQKTDTAKTTTFYPVYGNMKCSNCGHIEGIVGKAYHYCSFCGAKVEEVEDE